MHQFSKHGIKDKCYAVFGYRGDNPSDHIVNLSKKYNIFWYKDERNLAAEHFYIPSIRPHILKKFFKDKPDLGKNVFYHDSDILLVQLPKFENLLKDEVSYLSDTISYIGYNYIKECSDRYKQKYPELPENDILSMMCVCADISEDTLKKNQENSGGAQYLLKNIDSTFWEDVEDLSLRLYDFLKTYEETYPIEHHIQSWTSDMWAVLWTYWKRGNETKVVPELDFSWATNSVEEYHSKPIFHLAGVTESDSKDKFYKGKYIQKHIFNEYRNDKTIFDHISPQNATYEYVKVIKDACLQEIDSDV
jgi:hypothetical protein